MKIAMAIGCLEPGGSEKQISRLAVALKQREHEPVVIAIHGAGKPNGNLKPYLTKNNVQLIELAAHRDKRDALRSVLSKLSPDAVYASGYPICLDVMIAAYECRLSPRITRYENQGFARKEFAVPWEYEYLGTATSTGIVSISAGVEASLDQYHGMDRRKVRTIRNGVDLPKLTKAARRDARRYWGLKEGEVLIGHLANFRADGLKNQKMFVRVAAKVLETHPQAVFVMCGYHSPYQDEVEALARELDLPPDRVRFHGRLDDISMLAGWDVSCNTSITEGLSNALLESMSYGLPIVATHTDHTDDYLTHGENSFRVEVDDDKAMAKHLSTLIEQPKLAVKMGRAGRLWVEQNCAWDTVVDQWLSVFEGNSA